jgi:undecaprenyl-diphosphatase
MWTGFGVEWVMRPPFLPDLAERSSLSPIAFEHALGLATAVHPFLFSPGTQTAGSTKIQSRARLLVEPVTVVRIGHWVERYSLGAHRFASCAHLSGEGAHEDGEQEPGHPAGAARTGASTRPRLASLQPLTVTVWGNGTVWGVASAMDYTIDHALNHAIREHSLLVAIITGFANWGVLAFGVAACALWVVDTPREPGVWRRATAAGLSAAAVGLLANQVIAQIWHRPRPYQDHPLGILPLLTPSHDPSFPSDHATAAFAIAFGILFVARRTGWLFVAWATLIAASRVLAGMHYPTDVLAGAVIGLGAGFLTARVAMPALWRLVVLVSRLTDPGLEQLAKLPPFRELASSSALRRGIVVVGGSVLLAVFAIQMRDHLLDEMPLLALAAWVGVVLIAARLASNGTGDKRRLAP